MAVRQSELLAEPSTVVLADGAVIGVRPMRASDAPRLNRFHEGLSNETTYLRFFSVHPHLSADELHRYSHVDHRRREALVALNDGAIVGVARWDTTAAGVADIAFVVADAWQGRGIGSALLVLLSESARRRGIVRFTADTLPHNRRMLGVFQRAGLPCRMSFLDGLVHVELKLELEG